jgi:hypothetical protein
MKKKIAMIIIGAIAATVLFGCSSAPNSVGSSETTAEVTTTTTEATTTTTEATTTAKQASESDLEIKPYLYKYDSTWSDDIVCFLLIKNNFSEPLSMDFNLLAHDADDNVIGANKAHVSFVGSNENTIAFCVFERVQAVDHVSYTIKFNEPTNTDSIVSNLEIKNHISKKNVVVSITNNSDIEIDAKSFEIVVFYLDKNGKLVDFNAGYLSEYSEMMSPGTTLSKQFPIYQKYNSIEVYLVDHR